jgi:cytochrome c peroxidase
MLKKTSFAISSGIFGVGALMISNAQGPGTPPPISTGTTRYSLTIPPGFPSLRIPGDNVPTNEGVALGKRLFSETKLSGNNTQSCASCHKATQAFSDQGKALSVGIDGKAGTRNAMALFNEGYQDSFFWDGRTATLREQALQPIQNPVEMHQSLAQAVAKLSADSSYTAQFAKAFGSKGVTSPRIGLAIEQFLTVQLSANTKFDLVQQRKATFTALEQRGQTLFNTPFDPRQNQFGADCARCHGGPLFSNFQFRNNGLDSVFKDTGRGGITKDPNDLGKFKTPSLRNLIASGPYMHDGRFSTLEQVIQHYSDGIVNSSTLDPGLRRENGGVHLSKTDQAALVAFLKTLSDPALTSSAGKP